MVVVIALWFHLPPKPSPIKWYLIPSISIWCISIGLRGCLAIYRGFTEVFIQEINGILRITLTVSRPWRVQAGQHIYLRILVGSHFSLFQTHPFTIAWWDGNRISVLVKPRRGITRELLLLEGKKRIRGLIEGPYSYNPYGIRKQFGTFHNVVLLATGIGISAIVPYVKELMAGYTKANQTERIWLIWVIGKECK